MTEDSFNLRYEVGRVYGRSYQIGVRADPNMRNVNSFAVLLFYEKGDGSREIVARIDDTPHEGREADIHIDRLYRESGAERKDYDIDVDGWEDAVDYFHDRWERIANQYRATHE